MKKADFSPVQNYRKHKQVKEFLNQTGVVLHLTRLESPAYRQFNSGVVAIVKLDNKRMLTVSVHSLDIDSVVTGSKVVINLRLEAINSLGLKNYGLVAKLI